VVVGEDVDIYNPREVLWAVATRFQASRDLICLNGIDGYVIEPSATSGDSSKMGLDATARPEGPESEKYRCLTPSQGRRLQKPKK